MSFVFRLCVMLSVFLAISAYAGETNHFIVISEYVRELGAVEAVRSQAENEIKGHSTTQLMADGIRTNTRMVLVLSTSVSMLKGMKLNKPFEDLLPNISKFYLNEIEIYNGMTKIESTFLAGPQKGVNYGRLAALMPQLNAKLEYINKALFNATPLIFAILIDKRPDKNNHVSHLLITRAQRKQLIETIDHTFGKKLTQKNQNYTVSSASVLKAYLKKDFKSSDDPW